VKHLFAAQAGEEEVEDHEIRPDLTDDIKTYEAIRGRADLEPFTGEAMRQEIGDIGLVFDDRDVAHRPPPDGASSVNGSNIGGDGYGQATMR
jgi:hypothetical protein